MGNQQATLQKKIDEGFVGWDEEFGAQISQFAKETAIEWKKKQDRPGAKLFLKYFKEF